jgi:hypothetical protein
MGGREPPNAEDPLCSAWPLLVYIGDIESNPANVVSEFEQLSSSTTPSSMRRCTTGKILRILERTDFRARMDPDGSGITNDLNRRLHRRIRGGLGRSDPLGCSAALRH